MTVTEINALLYSPNHPRDQLERALADRGAFAGMARGRSRHCCRAQRRRAGGGNAGLAPAAAAHPAAPGFRPLAVDSDRAGVGGCPLAVDAADRRRSAAARRLCRASTSSCVSGPTGGPPALSQLLALGSGLDGALSDQREARAERRGWNLICMSTFASATSSTSAHRAEASSCSRASSPVVLLSAGIGATPVLAMLHALAAERSTRQVLWLHAARDRQHHPFRRRGAPPHGCARPWPQLCLLQRARRRRQDGRGLRRDRPPVAIGVRRARHHRAKRMSIFAGRRASWPT